MLTLEIAEAGYEEAASALLDANHMAAAHFGDLTDRLSQFGSMAGDDSWASDWAAKYDASAASAIEAYQQLVGALGALQRLTSASLANHRWANRRSMIVVGTPIYVGGEGDHVSLDESVDVGLRLPPTALGGDGGGPGWWQMIQDHLEGLFWPDADCERLREANEVWNNAAFEVERLVILVEIAASAIGTQKSPEVPLALTAFDAVKSSTTNLAESLRGLGGSCVSHADEIENHRHEIVEIAKDFLVESALIQGASHLLAIPTGSGSEWIGQTIQAERIGAAALKIQMSLSMLAVGVVARLGPLEHAGTTALREIPVLRKMAEARAIHASASVEASSQAVAHGFKSLGGSTFVSPAGLMYLQTKREHRLTHVLRHAYPNPTKRRHSIFREGEDVLNLVDEAWLLRGEHVPGFPRKYVVPMGRTVGVHGESCVTLVVEEGTREILTAYPSKAIGGRLWSVPSVNRTTS